ncbi:MAG: hypothetical protein ACYDBH_21975 [Acidobacteriaceae bacterium]
MLKLVFFEPFVADCVQQLRSIEFEQGSKVVLHAWNEFAAELTRNAGSMCRFSLLAKQTENIPSNIEAVDAIKAGDVFLANEFDPDILSSILIGYLDFRNITILAPVTACRWRSKSA